MKLHASLLLLSLAAAVPASAQFAIDDIALPNAILGAPYPAVELTTSNGFGPIQWSFVLAPSPPGGFVVGPVAAGSSVTTGAFCYGVNELQTGRPICFGNVAGFPGTYLINVRAQDANNNVATRIFTLLLTQELVISTATLPDAIAGQPYSAALQGAGGSGSYTWSIAAGALPSGLTLNPATGAITGTAPTGTGLSTFIVRISDNSSGASTTRQLSIDVVGGLRITTTALPLAVAGETLAFQLEAVGGTNLAWSMSPGWELPASFTLSPSGVLSGGRSTPGAFRFSIRVTDTATNAVNDRIFDFYVTLGPLRILETALPVAAAGQPYSAALTAAGGLPPYQWSFGTLATQGLSIDPQTGQLSGTPPSLGTFPLPIQIRDATGTTFTRPFNLLVVNTVTITTSSFPNGIVGVPFTATLQATGGQAPYRWSLIEGALPPGLSLDTIFGRIEGTPTAEGVFQFTIQVVDNGLRTAQRQLGMVVGAGIAITTVSLTEGILGEPYSFALSSSGGITPLTWSIVSGTLPAGLVLNPANGVISGTPTVAGSSSLIFRVTDFAANFAERALALSVSQSLAITTGATPNGSRGTAYSFSLLASGGRPPYAWTIVSGSLPPGLVLAAATGAITGTPTTTGSFPFGVELRDGGGQTARADFTIAISDSLTITTTTLSGTFGQALSATLAAAGGIAPYTFSQIAGTLPAGVTFTPATATLSGTPTQAGTFNVTFRVTDQALQTASGIVAITIALPPLPAVTIDGFDRTGPGGQTSVPLRISQPFPADITGTLTLAFASGVGGGDDTVRFTNGSRTIPFTIPAGATQAAFMPGPDAVVMTGTTAGTITLNASFASGGAGITPVPAPSKTVAIDSRAPAISSVTLQRSGNTLTAVVTGYTATHEISSGLFRFAAGSGSSLQQSEFTVPLTAAFTTWFQNAASNATGGQFRLTLPLTVSADAANVNLTSVTLTNVIGASAAVGP